MALPMNTERHKFPKSNEYQWRNLYLKQYGPCAYPPPMPRNPDVGHSHKESFMWRRGAVDGTHGDPGGGDSDLDVDGTLGNVHSQQSSLLDSQQHRQSGFGSLEMLTDEQLFSPSLFTFLDRNDSLSEAPVLPCIPQERQVSRTGSFRHLSMVLPSILRPADKRSSLPSQRDSSDGEQEEDETGRVAGAAALARLRRETWMLLMDNRIMSWFEREAQSRGRVVASVQRHLLEVVTWSPSQRGRVEIRPVSGGEAPPQTPTKESVAATVVSEDERLMQTLERFAPFFAVISPPERLLCLAEHVAARPHGGSSSVSADSVGLPLLSQYATWSEAYQNRKAWRLAPYSFFLIYDCGYNHAHIAALYVLVSLINKTSHTHVSDCLSAERRPRGGRPDTRGGRRAMRAKDTSQCPLLEVQHVTEDLFLAYEQSSARTTLPMALRVLDFLLDLIVDPDTAERFLSPDALRRQCSSYGAAHPFDKTPDSEKHLETSLKEKHKHSKASRDVSRSDVRTEDGTTSPSLPSLNIGISLPSEMEDLTFSMVHHLDDASFEELFVLVNWLVDAPTANSLIPVGYETPPEQVSTTPRGYADQDSKNSLHHSTRSRKHGVLGAGKGGASTTSDVRRSQASVPASQGIPAREPTYIVGRMQEFTATASLVEAITRYELQRRAVLEQRAMEMRQRALAASKGKKQRRRRIAGALHGSMMDDYGRASSIPMSDLPASTTLLSEPLIFITTYIRLHGASWLKELFGRFFNILRRESVLLYVNALDFEKPNQQIPSQHDSVSMLSFSGDQLSSPTTSNFAGDFFRWKHLSEADRQYYQRLERLEDLVCQDIQYVTEEFFSALHGKRSMTRLPQDISVLLTSLCTTVHLHLLSQHAALDMSFDKPAIRVRRCLDELRQRRVMSSGPESRGSRPQDPRDRLLRSIEHHRLAKFVLFDCWILPAMNNPIEFGFLSETSSNHLRWNVDAFARYLKILVNAPFVPSDGVDPYIYTTPMHSDTRRDGNMATQKIVTPTRPLVPPSLPPDRKQRPQPHQHQEATNAQRCHTVRIPPFINGIYDVSSGNLVQVFRDPGNEGDESAQATKFVFGDATPSETQHKGSSFGNTLSVSSYDQSISYSSMDHGRKAHCDLSGALSTLNESLGITGGGEEGEAFEDDTDVSPARILNIFCARTASDISAKVVTAEYGVPPAAAARCIDKIYSFMNGEHEMVRNAALSGTLIGYFKSSPYLTCLMAVLQHPHTASAALENAYQNNRKFYNALMKPLQDTTLLTMMSSLLGQRRVPMVDSNELISVISAIPMTASNSLGEDAQRPAEISAWELVTRRLINRRAIATSGESLSPERVIFPLLRRCGPTSPKDLLDATGDAIRREMGNVPLCFDTWWRAMTVALTAKAMNVLDESSDRHASQWEQWCNLQMQEANREYRGVCKLFTEVKGANLDIPRSKALGFLKERRGSRQIPSATSSLSRVQVPDSTKMKKRRQGRKSRSKSQKSERAKAL